MLNTHGTALAAGESLPARLVVFYFGNGVLRDEFQPTKTGADWQLSDAMQPLAEFKNYLNVVTGYDVKIPNRNGHHNGTIGALSGYDFDGEDKGNRVDDSRFKGPSIDQAVAEVVGGQTRFSSLQLAISRKIQTGEGPATQYISHKSRDEALPPNFSPADVYNKLFADFTPPTNGDTSPSVIDPRLGLRANLMDAVLASAKRLQSRVSYADKQRLDSHFNAISEVRSRIVKEMNEQTIPTLVGASCKKPDSVTDQNSDEKHSVVTKLMANLMSIAFACDMTRVVSVQFSGSFGNSVFREVGLSMNSHDISHSSNRPNARIAHKFIMKNLADLLREFKNTPEGTGNLLDQSCVYACTELGNGIDDDHQIHDQSVILAGGAGGALKTPGIHHSKQGGNLSDVLLTVARVSGANLDSVGGDAGKSTTPCTEVMT